MVYCENLDHRQYLPDDVVDVAEWIKEHNWNQSVGCALWLNWNQKIYTDSSERRFIIVYIGQSKPKF